MPETPGDSIEKKIVVEYKPSAHIFRKATHAAWRAQGSFKLLFTLLAALLLAVAFALGIGVDTSEQIPVLLSLLVGWLTFYTYPLIAFARKPEYRSPVRIEFGRDGFSYQRGEQQDTLAWSAIQQITEARNFYVLTMPKRFQLAIPKDSFAGGQEQHFRLLAATEGVPIRD